MITYTVEPIRRKKADAVSQCQASASQNEYQEDNWHTPQAK